MNEPVGDSAVDEEPEGRDTCDCRVEHLTFAPAARRLFLPPPANNVRRGLLREDQAVPALIRLDHFQRQELANERTGNRGAHLRPRAR